MRHSAWIAVTPERRFGCIVADISQTGARIEVNDVTALPDSFVLLLSSSGAARRYCRVIWRRPKLAGVRFETSLAEAAKPVSSDSSAEMEEPVIA